MNGEIYKQIQRIQYGENELIVDILDKFNPLIKKWSKKLGYEEAETDLIIYVIELINKINLNNFILKNDGAIINYISKSLKYKYINTIKKIIDHKIESVEYLDIYNRTEIEENIYLKEYIINNFNEKQSKIISYKFFHGYTDIEIGEMLNISRQSVNKNKIKILEKMKKEYFKL